MNQMMEFDLISSVFKGENPTYFIKKQTNKQKITFNVGLYWDIYRLISFKLGMMVKTTKLYI